MLGCPFLIFLVVLLTNPPRKEMRIKNRFRPCFDCDLAELLHLKNCIWRKAWHTYTQADWLSFRQIRNKCTQAQVSYFKEQFSLCGSNPLEVLENGWRINLENKLSSSQLTMSLNVDDVVVIDKKHMAELINHQFIKSGFLFDTAMSPYPSNISSSPTPSNVTSPNAPPSFSYAPLQRFSLQAVTESDVLKELLT